MGTLRFFEEVVSFKIRRTFGFADYTFSKHSKFPGRYYTAKKSGKTADGWSDMKMRPDVQSSLSGNTPDATHPS